ncbi:inositol monophosphatase family protein [Celerinatantimonas diazotrophica]|uniref:Fructose-1,6-bisphosphatase/inositol monophosphatase family enzyme n=1 Tax=Celerinatantimonas diazotrophica TaxID=412034 RepID=A0A4R1K285_9GAMM|nr:inositol monophosphatase [Celerinatantimonas diazotrophica]TCK58134.1 fructose-1,6-bisphosphatase/inositol monophosphatase family enzyme [Celerinatantimonas diazotrophica]CAG9297794.1 3'(2'),5'-bisphosphate nucleotidase CysQ [Celerinatantimonas diazotrophica]
MQLDEQQLVQLKSDITELARASVHPHYRHLQDADVHTKTSATDLVTVVDQDIEQQLTDRLRAQYPHATVIGEEAVSQNPQLIEYLDESELTFVIDPIDGTWNFAHGVSVFGVMVAVLSEGRCQHALLYDPIMDDWQQATLGQGAFYEDSRAQQRPIHVSDRGGIAQLRGFVPLYNFNQAMQLHLAPQLAGFARIMEFGCSCFEYRLLNEGAVDFIIAPDPKIWDHAPGQLILSEAGGYSCFSDGEAYHPGRHRGILLAANNLETWQVLMDHFRLV